jgi:hypothetical protein
LKLVCARVLRSGESEAVSCTARVEEEIAGEATDAAATAERGEGGRTSGDAEREAGAVGDEEMEDKGDG